MYDSLSLIENCKTEQNKKEEILKRLIFKCMDMRADDSYHI